MCGIAGIFHYTSSQRVAQDTLSGMLVRIQHRGPDESGIYLNQNVGLGHVRLSILDLETGHQPMSDEEGAHWIVFNGEIFNYIELREELKAKGYRFRTTSDTEVLLNLYKEYGSGCLEKLNGQFAFAIWNKKKKELFLARDRVGIRPLYYTLQNGTFLFGSEIKAILEYPEITPVLSPHALRQIFTFWSPLPSYTIFENIFELPAGHFMTINEKGLKINAYWAIHFPEEGEEQRISVEEAREQLNALYKDAVKLRLRADVPVGAYLSGGIDSSITTAFIREIFPDMLRTFSIGFTDKEFDESGYQKIVIDFLRTKHSGIKCSSEEIADRFPDVIRHTETPLLRTSPTPMYFLSRSVRDNHYKVVITGEGADEMFAGYNIFKETMIRRFWARQPDSRIRPLLLQKLYPYIPQLNQRPGALNFFFGYKLAETDSPFYSHLLRWNNTSRLNAFLSEDLKSRLKDYDPVDELARMLPESFLRWSPLAKAQWLEINIFMSEYLLSSQGDRMAMAHSVEGRYPFLDHRIMEFAAGLPPGLKLHGLTEKYLLKKMMKGRLPDEIVDRPKQAYRAPIASTFVTNTPDYLEDILSDNKIKDAGVFNPATCRKLLDKMKSNHPFSEMDNMALTGIISTQLLYKLFISKKQKLPCKEPANLRIIND